MASPQFKNFRRSARHGGKKLEIRRRLMRMPSSNLMFVTITFLNTLVDPFSAHRGRRHAFSPQRITLCLLCYAIRASLASNRW